MRKQLKKFLPDHRTITGNRWLKPFGDRLLHPRLWHLNRHSAAGAFAVGLFCGLIPGPFQMLGAAIAALLFRVNLPLSLAVTLYTNPLTIVPLYLIAYQLGRYLTGEGNGFIAPPEFEAQSMIDWMNSMTTWMLSVGKPLATGLFALAALLALIGYFGVKAAWRLYLIHAWQHRKTRRKPQPPN